MEESRLFWCAIDGWKILSKGSFTDALLALSLLSILGNKRSKVASNFVHTHLPWHHLIMLVYSLRTVQCLNSLLTNGNVSFGTQQLLASS